MWISRSPRPYLSYEVVRMVYFSYFHSIIPMALYSGVIHLKTILYSIFINKEQLVIVNSSSKTSCRKLLKELQILTIHSQYIYSLLMFVL
jgi:hypothetical protein